MFSISRIVLLNQARSLGDRKIFFPGLAISMGILLGILAIFVPPLYLIFAIGGIFFAYLLIFHIHWAMVVALLVLEILRDYNYLGNGTPFHPNGLMGLSLIAGAVYFFVFNKMDFSRLIGIQYFAGFLAACFISLLMASDNLSEGLTVTLRLASGLAIYAILVYTTDSIQKALRVIGAIILALAWPTISDLVMIVLGQGDKFKQMDTARLGGGTSGPGVYLAMLLILSLVFLLDARTKGYRFLWGSVCAIFGAGLFYSYSRAGWIGFAIGLIFIGIMKYKRLLLILPGFLIAVVLLLPAISTRFSDISLDQLGNRNSSTFAMRVELWDAGLAVFTTHNPLFGVGYGVERYRIGEYLSQYAWMPHNDYVGILVGTGLVGFLLFILWNGHWLVRLLTIYRDSRWGFDKTLSLAILALFVVSLVVRFSDNIVQTTGRLYPLVALVAVAMAIPGIRAAEERKHTESTLSSLPPDR